MKKILHFCLLIIFSVTKTTATNSKNSSFAYTNEYETSVTFPAGYAIGDYVEFVRVNPNSAGASGYYQVSLSYTRGNIASAATHIASISHSNPSLWREAGRINNNAYVGSGVNFTIDCNTEYANPRFRIRAVNTLGINTPILVYIKVTSINFNGNFDPLNITGKDTSISKFLPMTTDWDLYVGNVFTSDGAKLAIKALQNGNVGIGTANPDAKLTVNGNIHSKEVKVDLNVPAPDYVFKDDYNLRSLQEVENYIKENSHLPEIPSAKEFENNGINVSEMNMALLKKIEELTLYVIEMKKENDVLKKDILELKHKK
ncbi:hypothetical protein ACWA1F_13175 [Flavobacterium sp. 3-218]